MVRTPPVVPVVPEVSGVKPMGPVSVERGQTYGSHPVLTQCRFLWNLSVNNRCLVVFLLLRGRSEHECVERAVLCE